MPGRPRFAGVYSQWFTGVEGKDLWQKVVSHLVRGGMALEILTTMRSTIVLAVAPSEVEGRMRIVISPAVPHDSKKPTVTMMIAMVLEAAVGAGGHGLHPAPSADVAAGRLQGKGAIPQRRNGLTAATRARPLPC